MMYESPYKYFQLYAYSELMMREGKPRIIEREKENNNAMHGWINTANNQPLFTIPSERVELLALFVPIRIGEEEVGEILNP